MYSPEAWSQEVNTVLYAFVALVLQTAQALNVTAPGGHMYNVPTGNFTSDPTGDAAPTLVSYSQVAITGADDFYDGGVTIKDVFDVIVNNTREVTPTCTFSALISHSLVLIPKLSWNRLVTWVSTKQLFSEDTFSHGLHLATLTMDGLFVRLNSFQNTHPLNSNTQFS